MKLFSTLFFFVIKMSTEWIAKTKTHQQSQQYIPNQFRSFSDEAKRVSCDNTTKKSVFSFFLSSSTQYKWFCFIKWYGLDNLFNLFVLLSFFLFVCWLPSANHMYLNISYEVFFLFFVGLLSLFTVFKEGKQSCHFFHPWLWGRGGELILTVNFSNFQHQRAALTVWFRKNQQQKFNGYFFKFFLTRGQLFHDFY